MSTPAMYERKLAEIAALEARLAEARANAFQDALDCMRDRQARDHLAACLQDKYGVWWKTDSAAACQHDIRKPGATWSAASPSRCVVCGESWEADQPSSSASGEGEK